MNNQNDNKAVVGRWFTEFWGKNVNLGVVDEIAAPILFLCTPFAGFISGEIFNVNGGAVLAG